MSTRETFSALKAIAQPEADVGAVPQWLRLFPKDEARLQDRDQHLSYASAAEVIDASFAAPGRIHIDLEHSSLPGRKGGDTRAYGYVTKMEEREDGIWGEIDWTAAGEALMKDRAYWGVSPVLAHDRSGRIRRIVSVALTNGPALRQLTALNTDTENGMDFLKLVAEMLGLPADASQEDVTAALKKKLSGESGEEQVAMTALTEAGKALGLTGEVKPAQFVAQIAALKAQSDKADEQIAALTEREKRRDAEAVIDKAIREKRVGIVPKREMFIAMHMENPERTAEIISCLHQVEDFDFTGEVPEGDEISALTAEEIADKARVYQAARKSEGLEIDIATAVNAVMEGKA